MKTRLVAGAAAACLCLSATSFPSRSAVAATDSQVTTQTAPMANRAILFRASHLDGGAKAVVIRRPTARGTEDIIVVAGNASADDLAQAVAALMYSRRTQGQRVSRELRANVTAPARRTTRKTADQIRAAADLAKLAVAPVRNIAGLGSGRVLAISTKPVRARK